MLTEQPKAGAERLLSAATEFAVAAGDSRVDHHGVAGLHATNVPSDGIHYPGRIGTHDPGRNDRHAGHPAKDEQVEMVQRRGVNAYTNVVRVFDFRDAQTGRELEFLEPAVGGDRQSSHAATRGLYCVECYPAAVARASRIRLPFISPDVPI